MAESVAVVGSVCVFGVCVVCTGVVCCCNVGKSVSDSSAGAIWEGRCVVVCGGDFVFNAHGAGAVTARVFGGAELPVSFEDIGPSPSWPDTLCMLPCGFHRS